MSELKAYTYDDMLDGNADVDIEYYPKSEADKVIAELKEHVKGLILDNYLKDKELRHHKYKRCLANAEACMHKRWRPDEGFDYARSTRHMNKWLELAEKFKPNN